MEAHALKPCRGANTEPNLIDPTKRRFLTLTGNYIRIALPCVAARQELLTPVR